MIVTFIVGIFLILISPLDSMAGDGHAHGPDGSHISDTFESGTQGGVVTLSSDTEKNIGIKFVTVRARQLSPMKTLYGRIVTDPRKVNEITAPFTGRVEKIFVLPGSSVDRNDDLIRVTPVQVGGNAINLKAPGRGYVTELDATTGKIFNPTETLLTVSDLDSVLFEADLFDLSDADGLRNPVGCSVHTRRFSEKHFECRVETVDATFRGNPPVGHIHASIQNPETELKPGMTGEIHLSIGKPKETITVPKKVVLGKFERRFVYRKDGSTYFRTYVTLGETYGDDREVLSGLSVGDQVVTQGHYQLQFAKSDESPSSEHGHPEDHHTHDDHEDHDVVEHEHSQDGHEDEHHDHHDHHNHEH